MGKIGARIGALRRIRGMSRSQLAQYVNVTPATVGNWERGVTVPTADKMVILQRLFEVGYDYLLEGRGYPSV